MGTSLLPSFKKLTDAAITPFQLKKDAAAEAFLQQHYDFLIALNTHYRAGDSNFTFEFNSLTDAQQMVSILTDSEYGYTVEAPTTVIVKNMPTKYRITVPLA